MDERERRQALADFLRTRRARLLPADVGLPERSRRRTPGLRREEVAELATLVWLYLSLLRARRRCTPVAAGAGKPGAERSGSRSRGAASLLVAGQSCFLRCERRRRRSMSLRRCNAWWTRSTRIRRLSSGDAGTRSTWNRAAPSFRLGMRPIRRIRVTCSALLPPRAGAQVRPRLGAAGANLVAQFRADMRAIPRRLVPRRS